MMAKNIYGLWVMGYGLWLQNPCKLTREIQNYMAYEEVWLMPGMG